MTERKNYNIVHSSIWREEAEPDNPFVARAAYCRGYDVYGEMLGNARWVEMLYLLFRDEAPTAIQADLLEALAVALANPGPRDPSVHAAMCAGVCGSTAASSLMAALAAGAGNFAGGREIFLAMQGWKQCETDIEAWKSWFGDVHAMSGDVWPAPDHPPGFDPYGTITATPVRQVLHYMADLSPHSVMGWLRKNLASLEDLAGCPLALSGVASAALTELGFEPEQGEVLHLLLRLPGAAAHALEQRPLGYKKFPFGVVELESASGEGQT